MFGGPLTPPKSLKPQCKTSLKDLDISMPHISGHAHRARQPNTDHAAKLLHYRQREAGRFQQVADQFMSDHRNFKRLAEHEQQSDRRQLRDLIQNKLKLKIQGYMEELEKRREKLRNILAEEEQIYVRETVENAQKADDTKLADMKKRSEELREAKEAARLEIVKQKRIQQYSMRCVELRPILSRKQTEESKICQLQQMRENEARRIAEKEITMMWDDLLRKQDEAFMEREVQEAIIKYNRCKKDMDILTMQIRAKKLMNEQIKEQELENVKEFRKIQQIQQQEEQTEMQQKHEKRLQQAADLKRQIEIQQKFADQRKKEEIALDNAFARLAELELQREHSKFVDNKGQMRKEMETYKHHLEHLKQQSMLEEKELEIVIAEYDLSAKQKTDAAICQFHARRKKLHNDVLKERAEQVEFNKKKAERELACKKEENAMMRDIFETNRRLHNESDRIRQLSTMQYRVDLNKQIQYNYELKKREMEDAEKRLQQGLEEERKLQAIVLELVNGNISMSKEHPFRRAINEFDCHCKKAI